MIILNLKFFEKNIRESVQDLYTTFQLKNKKNGNCVQTSTYDINIQNYIKVIILEIKCFKV